MICSDAMKLNIPYTIVYKNIKNLYIRIKNGKVVVTAGKHFTKKQIEALIDHHGPSLQKTLAKQSVVMPKYMLFGTEVTEAAFFGRFKPTEAKYLNLLKTAVEEKIVELTPWLNQMLTILNLSIVPMKVKKLLSKYGSCHVIHREITISSFMAKIPDIYLKYVVLHEYAHLIEANHSKAFYAQLDKVMPQHKQIQRELRKIPIQF